MSVPKTDALPLGDAPTVGGYVAKAPVPRKCLFVEIQCKAGRFPNAALPLPFVRGRGNRR